MQNKNLNTLFPSLVYTLIISLFTQSSLATIEDRIEYKVNRSQDLLTIINQEIKDLLECSCRCQVILPEDFRAANGTLSKTFVITAPGNYCLGANINFEALSEGSPAIQILSSNVHLDLRNFTLHQSNSSPRGCGILIGKGYNPTDQNFTLQNITITNGSITNFSAVGILCYNNSFVSSGNKLPFQSLAFSDLNIIECGSSPSSDFASGINLDSPASNKLYDPTIAVAYKYVTIENCTVNRCIGNNAISIYTGDNIVIKNTQANDLTSTNSSLGVVGAYYITARNLQMYKCQGNGTKDLDPAATRSQVGSFLQGCINVYLSECQFNDTFGESDAIVNFNCSNSHNFIAENCQFNNAQGGQLAKEIAGIHMSDSPQQQTEGNGMKFINCQFNGARVSDANPGDDVAILSGFLAITLRNIIFENCQACNIQTTNPNFRVFGFTLGTVAADAIPLHTNVRNITFSNCTASDISGNNAAVGFDVYGANDRTNLIGEQPRLDNIILENCIAERIYSTTSTEIVAGIANENSIGTGNAVFPALFNFFVKGCRVADVHSNSTSPSPFSAGIIAYGVRRPVICENNVSNCDRGILLSGSDSLFPPNLFQLATTFADATAFPPVFIDLKNPLPSAAPLQSFFNNSQANGILVAPSSATIEVDRDYILAPSDLNTLGWQAGDSILYDAMGGGNINDLVSTTTYFLIVYAPGFAQDGVIQNNEVDNCSVAGYQDDLLPNTTTAWLNNTGFNNGTPPSHAQTFDISFAGIPPLDTGTLAAYPTPGNKYYNLSLIP